MRCALLASRSWPWRYWARRTLRWRWIVEVEIEGKQYTTFCLAPGGNKRYVYPLSTASGVVVTRHFPMGALPGEAKDHPHHRGMFFSHGEVQGACERSTTKRESMRSKRLSSATPGKVHSASVWRPRWRKTKAAAR